MMDLSGDRIRDLMAVQNLVKKKEPQSRAYEVLEAKLTKLRRDL